MILSDSELSISYLNIKGLHDSIVGCKLNDKFIRDNIFSPDITVLSETWGCSHNPSIQGYNSVVLKPNKHKGNSGGITLFYKKNFQTKIKVLKQSKHYIRLNLSSCIRNLSNELKYLYICITYIPPVKSPYYSEDIFPSIQNDILLFNKNESCVLLINWRHECQNS